MATHSSVPAWRIPGTGEPVGCRLWGRTESDTTEATQQQQQHALVLCHSFKSCAQPLSVLFHALFLSPVLAHNVAAAISGGTTRK